MVRFALLFVTLILGGCNNEVYVRDGVTDGDTFYLANQAWTNDDPALQSWVAYSLSKSTCQLGLGGENPARMSSYGCEFTSRMILLDTWEEKLAQDPAARDDYLDALLAVREAGWLDEYVVHYFRHRQWQVPAEVNARGFGQWRRKHLRRHTPQTRLIGSWNYRQR